VLCVYRQVKILKQAAAVSKAKKGPSDAVAIISYDEKPGIQAIATTAPDLPPEPGVHATFAREHEYKRYGTVSLLAGIDLVTGKVHALAKDRHRSREFIEFLELLDAAYPAHTAIKLILDNHSAHISKETKAWLADQPAGRSRPIAQMFIPSPVPVTTRHPSAGIAGDSRTICASLYSTGSAKATALGKPSGVAKVR
jgi:DDE superfamily endonuclease